MLHSFAWATFLVWIIRNEFPLQKICFTSIDWADEKERSMEPSLKIESELKIDWDGYTWVRTSVLLGDGLLLHTE